MFVVPEGDPLQGELESAGIMHSASAAIIQHRMDGIDWRCLLTSDV